MLPASARGSAYCCTGCEAVAALLRDEQLTRYYDLAPARRAPIGAAPGARSHVWLAPLVAAAEAGGGEACGLDLDVQGIHCTACVWLMNETFRRRPGAIGITVNPALGKARLAWRRGAFDVADWVSAVERFGYQLGPSRKRATAASSALTVRLGVVLALTMNVMLFSVSFYFGLPRGEQLFTLFSRLSVLLSTAVVVIGGWPFAKSAWQGLRQRVLHLDLPVALGIGLVYGTSLAQVAAGRGGDLTYFDTLNTFITLMLLGRFLQQRVLERNRNFLLEDDGAEDLWVSRIEGEQLAAVRAPAVKAGDRLLIAPGEVVPVDAGLLDEAAAVSTDWITGEAVPHGVRRDDTVAAGSLNAGRVAMMVVARTDFADSALSLLLRQSAPGRARGTRHLALWDSLARRWVLGVLALAGVGLALWLHRDPARALDVTVALLVVTCPCAIGIALPLAYELTQARLRRAGFFVRSRDLLDRLERVRTVIFDKTGTLTLGRLALADEGAVAALPVATRALAYNLACRSGHPVAACLARALAATGARLDPGMTVVETPGEGLCCRRPDGEWRLGRATFAAPGAGVTGTVLARDREVVTTFELREVLRPGARADVATLRAAGLDLWLISGDRPERAGRLAAEIGIPAAHALGGRTPAEKAAEVARIDRQDTLYLGDGVNDALAFEAAHTAGTVAVDRPVLPGRSDFFLIGEGLGPLTLALASARRLRVVVRRVLALSLTYNVFAVSVCLLGHMSPLRAALTMPASSLGVLLFTLHGLRERPVRAAAGLAIPAEVTS